MKESDPERTCSGSFFFDIHFIIICPIQNIHGHVAGLSVGKGYARAFGQSYVDEAVDPSVEGDWNCVLSKSGDRARQKR